MKIIKLRKKMPNLRGIVTIFTLLAVIFTVGILVKADTSGNGTNQLGYRESNRLDMHWGQVVQSAPLIPLYYDSACTKPINHYLLAGDWVVMYPDGAVCYPITVAQEGGSPEAENQWHYSVHYIQSYDQRYIAHEVGTFSGTNWSVNSWYNHLPTSIGYTSQFPGNGDTHWVGNNTNGFQIMQDPAQNGYYQLWTGDASTTVMSASWSQYCYYDTTHSDFVNADYSWNCTSQSWSTSGLNQGQNIVWYAGMDASGNFATGSRNIKWDTLGPVLSTTKTESNDIGGIPGLQSFITKYGHNGWLNASNKKAGLFYNISGRDNTSKTNNVSGVRSSSLRLAIDNSNAYGGYNGTSSVSGVLDTTYFAESITSLMNRTREGHHTVYYSMLDKAGNTGKGKQAVKVDTVYPNITAVPAKGQFNSTKDGIALNLTFSDPGSSNGTGSGIDTSTEQYQWVQKGNEPSDSAWQTYTGGTVTNTVKGEWVLYTKVSDIAGNIKIINFGTYYCGTLTGEIVNPVEDYAADEDIIASVLIHSDDSGDITPDNGASVSFLVKDSSGTVISSQTKPLVVPDNNTQLIWFRFHTPKYSGKLTLIATINSNLADVQRNPFSITHNVYYNISPNFTDMGGDFYMPGWFESGRQAPTANRSSGSWQEWFCYLIGKDKDSGENIYKFTLNTYMAAVSSSLKITADPDDPTYKTDYIGHITQKSGYGIMEKPSTTVTNTYPDANAVTKVQFTYGLYPEWNYQTDFARIFDQTGISSAFGTITQTFNLPVNPKFTNGTLNDTERALVKEQHVHFTPVAFPNGTYTAQITACEVWTPAGVLDSTAADSVTIKDGLYNDWRYEETTAEAIQRKH